jgi:hypothetical protein
MLKHIIFILFFSTSGAQILSKETIHRSFSFRGRVENNELITGLLSELMPDYQREEWTVGSIFKDYRFNPENFLPPLWNEIKTLDRFNFPSDSDGKLIIDVWDYTERMALYKYLIMNVKHCEWSDPEKKLKNIEEKYDPKNILWGLPLQHGWQFLSQRLMNAANR